MNIYPKEDALKLHTFTSGLMGKCCKAAAGFTFRRTGGDGFDCFAFIKLWLQQKKEQGGVATTPPAVWILHSTRGLDVEAWWTDSVSP